LLFEIKVLPLIPNLGWLGHRYSLRYSILTGSFCKTKLKLEKVIFYESIFHEESINVKSSTMCCQSMYFSFIELLRKIFVFLGAHAHQNHSIKYALVFFLYIHNRNLNWFSTSPCFKSIYYRHNFLYNLFVNMNVQFYLMLPTRFDIYLFECTAHALLPVM
jgi:hypothetical protein